MKKVKVDERAINGQGEAAERAFGERNNLTVRGWLQIIPPLTELVVLESTISPVLNPGRCFASCAEFKIRARRPVSFISADIQKSCGAWILFAPGDSLCTDSSRSRLMLEPVEN